MHWTIWTYYTPRGVFLDVDGNTAVSLGREDGRNVHTSSMDGDAGMEGGRGTVAVGTRKVFVAVEKKKVVYKCSICYTCPDHRSSWYVCPECCPLGGGYRGEREVLGIRVIWVWRKLLGRFKGIAVMNW